MRREGPSAALAVAVVLSLASCKGQVDPRRVVLRSEGAICFGTPGEGDGGEGGVASGVDLEPGKPLVIGVRSACLSNVCATARSGTCHVDRDGQRLVIKSELSWRGPEDLGDRCPKDCTYLEAQCQTDPLGAGTYVVVLGDRSVEVTLPSHAAVRCDTDRPPPSVFAPAPPAAKPAPAVSATPPDHLDPSLVPAAPGTGVVPTPPPGDTICLGPAVPNKARALKAGQAVAVTLLHKNVCSSLACTKAPGKCVVKRKGSQITVTPTFPAPTAKPTQPCTEDCTAIAATCRTDALPAGQYTLHVGAQQRELTIPAPSAPGCSP
ncbi:MAG: hypothetical protein JWP97_2255 [Labilithrix sp.]|nr:hypothetical protein [Labilithrix sp.]